MSEGIEAAKLQIKVESNALTVSGEVKQLGQAVHDTSVEGSKDVGVLTKGYDSFRSEVLPAVAVVTSFGVAVKKAYDLGEEGAQIERLKTTSTALAESMGSDMDLIVSKVKDATNNTISDYAIMQSASAAMTLGLGADADKMAQLAEVAAVRGRLMGETTSQAFNDIVRGIGRLSPMILDNLGIVIDADATYAKYAESVGKSTDQLSEMEKKQALLNGVLEDGKKIIQETGGLITDNATIYEQAAAREENAMEKLKTYMSGWWVDVLNGATGVLGGVDDQIKVMMTAYTTQALAAGTAYDAYFDKVTNAEIIVGRLQQSRVDDYKKAVDVVTELTKAGDTTSEAYQNAARTVEAFNNWLAGNGILTQNIYEASQMTDSWVKIWEQNHSAIDGNSSAVQYLDSVIKAGLDQTIKTTYEDYETKLKDLQTENKKLAQSADWFSGQYAAAPKKIQEVTRALQENKQALAESGYTAGDLVTRQKELEGELSKWQNVLESGQGMIASYTDKLNDNKQAQKELKDATEATIREFIFQQASAGLSGEALYEMAHKMGFLDDESYAAAEEIQKLKDRYAQTGDLETYTTMTDDLATAISNLKDRDVTITVTTIENEIKNIAVRNYADSVAAFKAADVAASGSSGSNAIGSTSTYTDNNGQAWKKTIDPDGTPSYQKVSKASGLDFVVPPGYTNDNYLLPLSLQSGERVKVTPAGQAEAKNSGGGDVINIYPANAVYTRDDLMRDLRQAKKRIA